MTGWYRRAGAELPFGDPSRERGAGMEGEFWRFTREDRVTIVLHGRCDRRWSLVAVAHEPGGVEYELRDDPIDAGPTHVRALGFEATWTPDRPWRGEGQSLPRFSPRGEGQSLPRFSPWGEGLSLPPVFGALGPAQMIPGLGQYWHPHLLRGTAPDGTRVYAEKNWGSRFAGHWWWGQAHLDEACVAFAGGRMLGGAPTALVVALQDRLIRLSPPLTAMTTSTAPGRWRIRAGGVELEAEADPARAHVLPVPIPGERRVELRSRQHLAGHLKLTVRRRGGVVFRGETERAGLERGTP